MLVGELAEGQWWIFRDSAKGTSASYLTYVLVFRQQQLYSLTMTRVVACPNKGSVISYGRKAVANSAQSLAFRPSKIGTISVRQH